MLVILGIVYFGRYEDYSNQETALAAQAARNAAVDYNPGGSSQTLQAYVKAQAPSELQNTGGSVSTAVAVYVYYPTGLSCGTTGSTNTSIGGCVRACVTANVNLPFLNISGIGMTQTATARIEQLRTSPSGNSGWTADASPPSACPQS